jgi:hypothetical protein
MPGVESLPPDKTSILKFLMGQQRTLFQAAVAKLNYLNARLVAIFPAAVAKIDNALEAVFGVISHAAFAIILTLILLVIGFVGGSIVIPRATFAACSIAWLWITRTKPLKELRALPRFGLIAVLALALFLVGYRFQRWALNAYTQQRIAESAPASPPIKDAEKDVPDKTKANVMLGEPPISRPTHRAGVCEMAVLARVNKFSIE